MVRLRAASPWRAFLPLVYTAETVVGPFVQLKAEWAKENWTGSSVKKYKGVQQAIRDAQASKVSLLPHTQIYADISVVCECIQTEEQD